MTTGELLGRFEQDNISLIVVNAKQEAVASSAFSEKVLFYRSKSHVRHLQSKSVNIEVSDKKITKSSSEIINHLIVALTDG